MGVDWRAALDNSNMWLNNYAQSWANTLTPAEKQAAAAQGIDLSAINRAGSLGYDPLKWHGQLGMDAAIANETRYANMLALAQLGQAQAAGQLNETGALLQQRRQTASDQLNQTGEQYAGVLRGVGKGYDAARNEIESAGRTGRQDLMDRERQALGATESSLASRGLGGTTVLDNARRGVRSDTNRSLGALNESLAGLRGGLAERRTGAEAQAGTNLANFMQQRTGFESGLTGDLAQFMGNRAQFENSLLNNRIGIMERRVDQPWSTEQAANMAQVGAATKKPNMFGQILGGVAGSALGGLVGGLGTGLGMGWGSSLFGGAGGGMMGGLRPTPGAGSIYV